MLILIDNKSGVPIYDQIFTQIKGHILSGALKTEEPLPSIRGLAKDLRISVITTKRAYDELEKYFNELFGIQKTIGNSFANAKQGKRFSSGEEK